MPPGSDAGTSTSLTVSRAAEAIENLPGIFSDMDSEDKEPVESQPEPQDDDIVEAESPAPEDGAQPEQGDEDLEESDDRDEQPAQPAKPKVHKVKIDGEELEVPEDELLKGYSRTKDYTQKTQKLSEERKAFETEAAQMRERLAAELDQLATAVKSYIPEEPDWDKLREENPTEFPQVFAEYQLLKDRLKAVEAKRQEAIEAVMADRRKVHEEHLRGEYQKLIEAVPEWSDREVAKKAKGEIFDYAKNLGYSEDQLNEITDHRVMLVLRKAMMYDTAEKAKQTTRETIEKKIEKVTVPPPGSKPQSRNVSELTRSKQRLAKTGRREDAVPIIASLLDD